MCCVARLHLHTHRTYTQYEEYNNLKNGFPFNVNINWLATAVYSRQTVMTKAWMENLLHGTPCARETKHEHLHPKGQSDGKSNQVYSHNIWACPTHLREQPQLWSSFLLADNAIHSGSFKLRGLIEVYKYLRKSLGRNKLLPELPQSCQNSLPKTCCLCHRQEPLNQ